MGSWKRLPWRVLREHCLEFRAREPFAAIVNLGVTEHLPDYRASLAKYRSLLKPGGRILTLFASEATMQLGRSGFWISVGAQQRDLLPQNEP